MFLFYYRKEEINQKEYDLVIHIKRNIDSKSELFESFSSQLQFPAYFGQNWDAFYDCLCDLTRLHKTKFLILHEDLPFRERAEERKIYIDLLFDIDSVSLDLDYKIDVAFPVTHQEPIRNVG
jgi:RNAse (barnase) inhibitor barstar